MSERESNSPDLEIPYPSLPFFVKVCNVLISKQPVYEVKVTAEELLVDNGSSENILFTESAKYVHRECKVIPGNICMQMKNGLQHFTLIDFGTAYEPCSWEPEMEHSYGTPIFKSISSHLMCPCAPDHDLMGLFYTVVYLYCGSLPCFKQVRDNNRLRWKMHFTYPGRMLKYIMAAKSNVQSDADPAVLQFMDNIMRAAERGDYEQMLAVAEVCRGACEEQPLASN